MVPNDLKHNLGMMFEKVINNMKKYTTCTKSALKYEQRVQTKFAGPSAQGVTDLVQAGGTESAFLDALKASSAARCFRKGTEQKQATSNNKQQNNAELQPRGASVSRTDSNANQNV